MDLDKLEKQRCQAYKKDVLENDFRDDIFVQAHARFDALGITKKKLKNWQDKYPLLYPWNTAYEVYRINVNRRYVVYPLIIAMCQKEKDVIKAMKIVIKYKLNIAIRGGAHCVEPFSLSDGVVIDQSRRTDFKIDKSHNQIFTEPGVLNGPLIMELSKNGYVFPAGSCPNVGLIGYLLGGGISLLGRRYGAGCDNLLSATVLLANGKKVNASADEHSDLFWALKGAGGGNFGIILDVKLQIHPYSKKLIYYEVKYDFNDITLVLPNWSDWSLNLNNNDIGCEFRFTNGGGSPGASGVYFGSKKDLIKLIQPLVDIKNLKVEPVVTVKKLAYADVAREFAGKGRWPPFTKVKNGFLKGGWNTDMLKIVKHFMAKGAGSSILELNSLSGQFRAPKPSESAFIHRNVDFWVLINAHWYADSERDIELSWARDFYKAISPYLTKQCYQNMPDLDFDYNYALKAYYGKNLAKLVDIKNKYDPTNVFKFDQSIPLTLQ